VPYITPKARREVIRERSATTPGELAFLIAGLVDGYVAANLTFDRINAAIGVLESVKQELYRRVAVGYEDRKRIANGEVFDSVRVLVEQQANAG